MKPKISGPAPGLVRVPTDALETLLRAVHRETIVAPLSPVELARHGLQAHSEFILASCRDLDLVALRALLVAVLAERRFDHA